MTPVVGVQPEREDAAFKTPPTDDRLVIKWLETQPDSIQKQ